MEDDPTSRPDPLLGPRVPFDPEQFGYFPDISEDDRNFIKESSHDLTLLLLLEAARGLEAQRGTAGAYPDLEQRLQSFRDRIELRKMILGGES